MSTRKLPARADTVVLFAHGAYQLGDALKRRNAGIKYIEARSPDEALARIGEKNQNHGYWLSIVRWCYTDGFLRGN